MDLRFTRDQASLTQIRSHLESCSASFIPPLSDRVDIVVYVGKLMTLATRFESWSGKDLAGLVAAYCNATNRDAAFITNVSVLPHLRGRGIASRTLEHCIAYADGLGFRRLELEVTKNSHPAVALYERIGFHVTTQSDHAFKMIMELRSAAP